MSRTPRPRKCPVCREPFTPKRIPGTLRITKCCLNPGCVLDYAQGVRAKDFKKETAKMRKEFNHKDLSWQHAQCKRAFNRMRVLEELVWFAERGLEPTCISCAKPLGGDQWCCGHFKTVGSQGNLRYDRLNTYLQHNKYCNMELSGNIYGNKNTIGYIEGLKLRFGEEAAKAIIDYCETNTSTVKWNCKELEEMRAEWNKKIRELEKRLKKMQQYAAK